MDLKPLPQVSTGRVLHRALSTLELINFSVKLAPTKFLGKYI